MRADIHSFGPSATAVKLVSRHFAGTVYKLFSLSCLQRPLAIVTHDGDFSNTLPDFL